MFFDVFTGIIRHLGTVAARSGNRLWISAPTLAASIASGDSVAVDGVCLTAVDITADGFASDLLADTLAATTLGALPLGASVHLEPAMRAADAFGGHFVQGHVDAAAEVLQAERNASGDLVLRVELSPALEQFVNNKGSIALDGVSLTVQRLEPAAGQGGWSAAWQGGQSAAWQRDSSTGQGGPGWFEVSLIPETLKLTKLGDSRPGMRVNVEADMLVKAVVARLTALGYGNPAEPAGDPWKGEIC